MRVQVQKWGNSLALRIPKPFAQNTGVREGSVIDVAVVKGQLVAVSVRTRKPRLRDLLAQVRRSNLHEEIATGRHVGREVW